MTPNAYAIHGDYYAPDTDIDGADPVVQTHYAVETADTEAEAQALVADLAMTNPAVAWYYVNQGELVTVTGRPVTEAVTEPVTEPELVTDVGQGAAEPANVLYVAGWNIPGFLPESGPMIFDNETDAIRYLTDTVELFWDEDYRVDTTWTAWNEVDEKWAGVFSSLPYETAPFNITNNDRSLAFWVTVVPKPDLPYNAEGN